MRTGAAGFPLPRCALYAPVLELETVFGIVGTEQGVNACFQKSADDF